MDFRVKIREQMKERCILRFDAYLMSFLGFVQEDTEMSGEDIRKRAYHTFLCRIGSDKPASLPTIRRWFGIHDYRKPSREQVLRICLALRVSVEEAQDFLMRGIGEPSFQINDYMEMIVMYCLEKRTGCHKCETMIEEYESCLDACSEINHEANTGWLFQQFEYLKKMPEQEFMYWMWENAGIFKGYSRTAQEYLEKYRKLIVDYVRQDTKKSLELLLAETTYAQWRAKRRPRRNVKESEWIRRYVRQAIKSGKGEISESLAGNILELTRLAYSEGENKHLMMEVFLPSDTFSAVAREQEGHSDHGSETVIKKVSGKYISDLFNIPLQNERMLKAKSMLCKLEKEDKEKPCPQEIRKWMDENCQSAVEPDTVDNAAEWLREFILEGKRRRLMVKRTDLLPMILYVAQQKYVARLEKQETPYRQEEAVKVFRELADATMIACNMAPLNEEYLFDWMLLSCYQKQEMYGNSDLMECM